MFELYYDIASDGFPFDTIAMYIMIIFLAIIAGFIDKKRNKVLRITNALMGSFFVVVFTIGIYINIIDFFKFNEILERYEYSEVEGYIENLIPMSSDGREDEMFTVNDIFFSYSYYSQTGAFNQTISHGSPIREGMYVKIHYYNKNDNNLIFRLYIKKDTY